MRIQGVKTCILNLGHWVSPSQHLTNGLIVKMSPPQKFTGSYERKGYHQVSHISRWGGQGEKQELLPGADHHPPETVLVPQIGGVTSPCILIFSLFELGGKRGDRNGCWEMWGHPGQRSRLQAPGEGDKNPEAGTVNKISEVVRAPRGPDNNLTASPQTWPWLEPAWAMPLPAISS